MGVRNLVTPSHQESIDEEVFQQATLRSLRIRMGNSSDADDVPTIDTDYSYSLRVRPGNALLQARSVFGVMYGLESFVRHSASESTSVAPPGRAKCDERASVGTS